jgi:hypothetical protein
LRRSMRQLAASWSTTLELDQQPVACDLDDGCSRGAGDRGVYAVRCAVETQRAMGERSAGVVPSSRVEFRIGIHVHRRAAESDAIEARWGHPVAYLNSGSVLSPSLVPPGNRTFLSANFRVS